MNPPSSHAASEINADDRSTLKDDRTSSNRETAIQNHQAVLELPESLRQQLLDFQRLVWKSKMLEALWLACVGFVVGFLIVFAIDRWIDTSPIVRGLVASSAFALWLFLPWAFHRWVWKHRRYDQLAKLLRQRSPNFGDELLGVIELAENPSEQSRSPALCAAALRQVAQQAATRDLNTSAPVSNHRRWGTAAASLLGLAMLLSLVLPYATWNALTRFLAPWRPIDRYTFAQVERLPDRLVVPHGESFTVDANLKPDTLWSPKRATLSLARHSSIRSSLAANRYEFSLPSLSSAASLDLRIGDFTHRMTVEPKLRPELTSLHAAVQLPEYLQLPEVVQRDLRGGSMNVVAGSQVVLEAVANRNLRSAELLAKFPNPIPQAQPGHEVPGEADQPNDSVTVIGTTSNDSNLRTEALEVVEGITNLSMSWSDEDGLTSRVPLRIALQGHADASPMVGTEDLARQAIVLNTEQLNFRILATDDFGVRQVGMEWNEISEIQGESAVTPISRTLAKGGPNQMSFGSQGTFRPIDLGIESKAIELRMWAEDYLPGRPRSYSPPHRLLVLTPDEHAVWITEQLNKWHRHSLDVRDRELQLYETNKELRALPLRAFEDSQTRQRLEDQAAGEALNERRLKSLTGAGESLLRLAARNPEMGVGHLERWAEVLKSLEDIAANRMPKVTDLLQQASRSNKPSQGPPKEKGPAVGTVRNTPQSGKPTDPSDEQDDEKRKPPMPSIVDIESSQQPPPQKTPEGTDAPSKPGDSKLGLPTTVLIGPPQNAPPPPESPAQQKTDEAVREQEDLLAEFERLADEMNKVLGELEGSTLVKRLKSASREQSNVAQELGKRMQDIFATAVATPKGKAAAMLQDLTEIEAEGSLKISNIVDDLDAFYERRRSVKFGDVLKEMQDSEVVASIRQLGDELVKEQGMSIAQAEYWSDTLDRWAEDLVDPACKGSCPGSKNADSLPPSLILEVLQILEGQVNLREQTRVAEQAREATGNEEHRLEGNRLANGQEKLGSRTRKVVEKIEELPDGSTRFADEVSLMSRAESLMADSASILQKPDTSPTSLAIQTEIIELLLQSKRINPKAGGGGGGKSPGGGGKGDTGDAALALLGAGLNPNEKRETRDVSQATGVSGSALPEEFRDGLNQYFNRLEQLSPAPRTTP